MKKGPQRERLGSCLNNKSEWSVNWVWMIRAQGVSVMAISLATMPPYSCWVAAVSLKGHWPHWHLQRYRVKGVPSPLSLGSSDLGHKTISIWHSTGHKDGHKTQITGLIIEEGILSPRGFSRKKIAQLHLATSLGLQRKPAFFGWQSRKAENKQTKKNKQLVLDKQTQKPDYPCIFHSMSQ